MTIEKKVAANNNGFPATIYGGADSGDVDKYGSKTGGSGSQREYTIEIGVEAGKDLVEAQAPGQAVTVPAGYVVESSALYVEDAFTGTVSVGLTPADASGGGDADALFTAASPAADVVPGTPGGPAAANTALDQDYVPYVSAGTAGKGKLLVKLAKA